MALVAILAASSVAAWQWRVATREKARAEQRFRDVRQLANTLIFKIHDAVLPLPGSTAVRHTIVDEAIGYLEGLEADSGGDAALRLELASAYRQIGSILGNVGAANLGDRDGAIRQYERARAILLGLDSDGADRNVLDGLVDAELRLSNLYIQRANRTGGIAMARSAVEHAGRQSARFAGDDRANALTARAFFGLAMALPTSESPPVWRRTLEYYEHVLEGHPDDAQAQSNVALAAKYLGSVFETTRDWEGARTQYARALELDERRLQGAPEDPRVQFDAAISFSNTAAVAGQMGDVETAVRLFDRSLSIRRHLAATDPTNMQALGRLGYLLARVASFHRDHGDLQRASRLVHESIPLLRKASASTGYLSARGDLGFAYLAAWLHRALGRRWQGRRRMRLLSARRGRARKRRRPGHHGKQGR